MHIFSAETTYIIFAAFLTPFYFYLQRKLLRDLRQVRDSCLGLVERHYNEILKELPLLQIHQVPLQGAVPPRLPQHGLDRHQPLAMC